MRVQQLWGCWPRSFQGWRKTAGVEARRRLCPLGFLQVGTGKVLQIKHAKQQQFTAAGVFFWENCLGFLHQKMTMNALMAVSPLDFLKVLVSRLCHYEHCFPHVGVCVTVLCPQIQQQMCSKITLLLSKQLHFIFRNKRECVPINLLLNNLCWRVKRR